MSEAAPLRPEPVKPLVVSAERRRWCSDTRRVTVTINATISKDWTARRRHRRNGRPQQNDATVVLRQASALSDPGVTRNIVNTPHFHTPIYNVLINRC